MTKQLSNGRGWMADAAADSIARMDANYGRPVPITSAGRTYAEQAAAYQLYKSGRGPLALPPGTSVHEKGMACDFGNGAWGWLGQSKGLGWNGARANDFGWRRTVSSESWHDEYDENHDAALFQQLLNTQGYALAVDGQWGAKSKAALADFQRKHGLAVDGQYGPASLAALRAAQPAGGGGSSQWPANEKYGADWVKAIQNKLNRLQYGPLDEDGKDGPQTQAAVKKFQTDKGLSPVDGIAGPITNNALDQALSPAPVGSNTTSRPTMQVQLALQKKNYDIGSGGADGNYGPATTAAVAKFQKDNGLNADGIYGPLTDEKLFQAPPVTPPPTNWPTNGHNATTRPTKDIQALVGLTGSQIDGNYGPITSMAVAKWQSANGLAVVDGIWGPASDLKGFPGVPLPGSPADPTTDPTYGKKIPTYEGASWADVSPNKSVRTGYPHLFIVHHAADTSSLDVQRKRFMMSNDRNVSPNWLVGADGSVSEIVPPDNYRAWTTGQIDHQAVTCETQNTSADPTWGISQQSHEAIAQLVAWAAHRYNIPIQPGAAVLDANGNNVVTTPGILGHRDTPAGKQTGTSCPGPSMNMSWIISRAKDIYTEKYTSQPPVTPPVDPQPPVVPAGKVLVDRQFLVDLKANEEANADEIGKYLQ